MAKLTAREIEALKDAARPGRDGWGLFMPRTTAKLSGRGYFEREKHPIYGMQYRITEFGRAALKETLG